MLDLEVVPERSLGNEQWEFILGMNFFLTLLRSSGFGIRSVKLFVLHDPLHSSYAILNVCFVSFLLINLSPMSVAKKLIILKSGQDIFF